MMKTNKKHPINLIGISGKIGSGKDTVGKILQYLNTNPSGRSHWSSVSFEAFCKYSYCTQRKKCIWEIKKYADKLKEIVCLLIGCTREQLEDREFKDKELGEEWRRYYVTKRGFVTKTYIDKSEIKKYAESTDDLGKNYLVQSEILTPRKLLQLLGTEAGRNIIHPNIWVNALFADFEDNKSDWLSAINSNWIITDVRFPNEAKAIKDRGGIIVRVERPKKIESVGCVIMDMSSKDRSKDIVMKYTEHLSETALDDYEFDAVIENNGSMEELVEKVKQLNLV